MCKEQYTIGVDYGSLSARGVLVRVRDGEIARRGGVRLSARDHHRGAADGTPLPGDWFLEHPQDYLDAMSFIVPRLRAQSGIPAAQIVGLAIDFTCSTMVPLDKQGQGAVPERSLCLPASRVGEAVEAPRREASSGGPFSGSARRRAVPIPTGTAA